MKHSTFGNPLIEGVFDDTAPVTGDRMTIAGTARKTLGLVAITCAAAAVAWMWSGSTGAVPTWALLGGLFASIGLAWLTVSRPHLARITGPMYATTKGATVGAVSWYYNTLWDGIPMQAAVITLGITLAVTAVYSTGRIRPNDKFKSVVASLTLGVFVIYLATILLSVFGVEVGLITGSSGAAILINVIILGIAIANLVVDYSYVEDHAHRAERNHEWYAAFTVLTTVIWIYLEVLRLLAKANSRR